jgi:predicted metal-dependent RNase
MSEKKISVYIMDRTGDTRNELLVAEAEQVARQEMGKGKWLRLVAGGGTSEIIRTISDLDIRLGQTNHRLFEDADEAVLMAAIMGG